MDRGVINIYTSTRLILIGFSGLQREGCFVCALRNLAFCEDSEERFIGGSLIDGAAFECTHQCVCKCAVRKEKR